MTMGKGNAMRLHKALIKKLNLNVPSVKIWERLRALDSQLPRSPTTVLTSRDVRKGFFTVYVGEEAKRYAIPLSHLKHPVFLELLRRAEEEFGFSDGGSSGLQIPCDTAVFDRLLLFINRADDNSDGLPMDQQLLALFT